MPYNIPFTDEANKGNITVEDSSINTETSMKLPGRLTTDYGQSVNENFLHLLENFANASPPANPVEGQLWYDTTQNVDQLKIYDGTNWVAAGGLKKGPFEPEITNSVAGQLPCNALTGQPALLQHHSAPVPANMVEDALVVDAIGPQPAAQRSGADMERVGNFF